MHGVIADRAVDRQEVAVALIAGEPAILALKPKVRLTVGALHVELIVLGKMALADYFDCHASLTR